MPTGRSYGGPCIVEEPAVSILPAARLSSEHIPSAVPSRQACVCEPQSQPHSLLYADADP